MIVAEERRQEELRQGLARLPDLHLIQVIHDPDRHGRQAAEVARGVAAERDLDTSPRGTWPQSRILRPRFWSAARWRVVVAAAVASWAGAAVVAAATYLLTFLVMIVMMKTRGPDPWWAEVGLSTWLGLPILVPAALVGAPAATVALARRWSTEAATFSLPMTGVAMLAALLLASGLAFLGFRSGVVTFLLLAAAPWVAGHFVTPSPWPRPRRTPAVRAVWVRPERAPPPLLTLAQKLVLLAAVAVTAALYAYPPWIQLGSPHLPSFHAGSRERDLGRAFDPPPGVIDEPGLPLRVQVDGLQQGAEFTLVWAIAMGALAVLHWTRDRGD